MSEIDELDLWELVEYLASELNTLSQHRDILGDGYIGLEKDEDFDLSSR